MTKQKEEENAKEGFAKACQKFIDSITKYSESDEKGKDKEFAFKLLEIMKKTSFFSPLWSFFKKYESKLAVQEEGGDAFTTKLMETLLIRASNILGVSGIYKTLIKKMKDTTAAVIRNFVKRFKYTKLGTFFAGCGALGLGLMVSDTLDQILKYCGLDGEIGPISKTFRDIAKPVVAGAITAGGLYLASAFAPALIPTLLTVGVCYAGYKIGKGAYRICSWISSWWS